MKILLDTHCFLWWIHEPERLSPEVLERIADERHFVMLSAASAWEIAIKYALGKLKLPQPPADFIPERCASNRILTLAIQHEHALRVAALPMHHTDPFDRLLVAQAQIEGCVLVTADPQIRRYDANVLWAAP